MEIAIQALTIVCGAGTVAPPLLFPPTLVRFLRTRHQGMNVTVLPCLNSRVVTPTTPPIVSLDPRLEETIVQRYRLLTTIAVLTLVLQALIVYNQFSPPRLRSRVPAAQEPTRNVPADVASIDVGGMPINGNADAKVVLIEFSDYECPFCARHVNTVEASLEQEFIDSGKLRHIALNNPLPMHSNARFLASVAICAGQQNRFWEMRSSIFDLKVKTKEDVLPVADKLQLDRGKFDDCLALGTTQQIDRDQELAKQLQLTSTPSFGIGRIDSTGRVRLKKVIIGAQPLTVFQSAIEAVLAQSGD